MIFIDTGPFLARYHAGDANHTGTLKKWKRLDKQRLFTSQHVLDELFTLLARRTDYRFAAERASEIYASASLAILRSTEEDEVSAVKVMQKYADQKVSFADCLSFVLMEREGLQQVLTFDRHFELAGFKNI